MTSRALRIFSVERREPVRVLLRPRLVALVPPQDQRIEHAVAEGMPAQRLPALGPGCGKQLRARMQASRYSQITIESNRVRPSSVTSVGIFPSGLSRITSRFGFDIVTTLRTLLDPVREAGFVREHHDLADVRRTRRPVQFMLASRASFAPLHARSLRDRAPFGPFPAQKRVELLRCAADRHCALLRKRSRTSSVFSAATAAWLSFMTISFASLRARTGRTSCSRSPAAGRLRRSSEGWEASARVARCRAPARRACPDRCAAGGSDVGEHHVRPVRRGDRSPPARRRGTGCATRSMPASRLSSSPARVRHAGVARGGEGDLSGARLRICDQLRQRLHPSFGTATITSGTATICVTGTSPSPRHRAAWS